MTWMAWRQFRGQFRPLAAVVAVLLVAFAVTAAQITDLRRVSGSTELFLADVQESYQAYLYQAGGAALFALPVVVGVFWGAPLVARELEAGTHRLVWNQSITRTRWLAVTLPPVDTGAIVAQIGFNLAPAAKTNFEAGPVVATVTLVLLVATLAFFRGMIGRLAIFLAVLIGYLLALALGDVDTSAIAAAPWVGLPDFEAPSFSLAVLPMFLPAVVALIAEGDNDAVPFVVAVNPAAQDLGLRANELVKQFGAAVNGRGGGKADLAQGSGKGAAGIDAALAALRAEIDRS